MSDTQFTPYPRANAAPKNAVLIQVASFNQTTQTTLSGRMTEAQALAVIAATAEGRPQQVVPVKPDQHVYSISDREVILEGNGLWRGQYTIRVVIGTRNPAPST